jgi:dethiobiotin synthetase
MQRPLFITGIGTDVGKTLISAILTEALQADYWKPVQAGFEQGTDAAWVKQMLSNKASVVHQELYKLKTPASPHIAARMDGIEIDGNLIKEKALSLMQTAPHKQLIIEGAGGLLVPLSRDLMVADLIKILNARVVLVSRNYLGSINHSLLTAAYCRANDLDVTGWIFNDDYLHYESEIVSWSGYPSLGAVPKLKTIDPPTIKEQANRLSAGLSEKLQEA